MHRVTIKTETGSVYVLNTRKKTWAQTHSDPNAPKSPLPLRTKNGQYNTAAFALGRPLTLFCDPINPMLSTRLIRTSNIIRILRDS